jgi:hypothetical protein
MIFFLALAFYLTTFVISLICFIAARKSFKIFIAGLFFHFIFLLCFVINNIWNPVLNQIGTMFFSFSLLFLCCSGMILFGLIINEPRKLYFKIYFGLYLLSFPVFIIKPSALINFLLYQEIKNIKQEQFLIQDNYFLEKQNTTTSKDNDVIPYKFVQKQGLFTKTIKRDISFGFKPDSVKTLLFQFPDSILIKAFGTKDGKPDSLTKQILN